MHLFGGYFVFFNLEKWGHHSRHFSLYTLFSCDSAHDVQQLTDFLRHSPPAPRATALRKRNPCSHSPTSSESLRLPSQASSVTVPLPTQCPCPAVWLVTSLCRRHRTLTVSETLGGTVVTPRTWPRSPLPGPDVVRTPQVVNRMENCSETPGPSLWLGRDAPGAPGALPSAPERRRVLPARRR